MVAGLVIGVTKSHCRSLNLLHCSFCVLGFLVAGDVVLLDILS